MKVVLKKILYSLFCMLPINKKIITFESFSGKKYADNPRSIYEKMKNMNLDYRYKWFMNKTENTTNLSKKEIIYKGTIKWLYYTAISSIWVKNTGVYGGLKKRKGQIYIQTWHGIPIKKMGLDVDANIVNTSSLDWDYVISPNDFYNKCLNSTNGTKLNYLEVGYPRNDIFYTYSNENIAKIKNKFNITNDKIVILYAPTFRDSEISGESNINQSIFYNFPDQYIILYRAHPHRLSKANKANNFIDVSQYSDIAELMLISDILVTDYSSVLFDYLNLKKPMIYFAYDLEHYKDIERGFYIDYKTLPGPIAKTPEELIKCVKNIDNYWTLYKKRYNQFIKKYCPYEDGHASERVIDFIINLNANRR